MAELGVMPALSGAISFDKKMEELFGRFREVISWYRLSFMDDPLERWWVYLLGIFSNITMADVKSTCERLLLSENQQARIVWTIENAMRLLRSFSGIPTRKPSEVYRALLPFRAEELLFLMGRDERESTRKAISHFFTRYRNTRIELTGKDLREMGIPPGPTTGKY